LLIAIVLGTVERLIMCDDCDGQDGKKSVLGGDRAGDVDEEYEKKAC
jgi:hypothetical protein